MARGTQRLKCSAVRSNGKPCANYAIHGGTVCHAHGGSAPHVKAAAKRRVERAYAERAVATYGLPVDIEPLDALLQELRRTAGHVAWLGELVGGLHHDPADLSDSQLKQYSPETGTVTTSVWVDLYMRERAHFAKVASDCLRAGVEERKVKLAEDQGRLVAGAIRRIVESLGLDPASDEVRTVVRRELTLIDGGAAA